jgi:hypothetical protein
VRAVVRPEPLVGEVPRGVAEQLELRIEAEVDHRGTVAQAARARQTASRSRTDVASSAAVSPVRRLLRWTIFAVATFAFITYIALETNDVARIRTKTATNSWRETHVWIAESPEGTLWIEAATPDRPWLLELERDPNVELVRDSATTFWRAVPVEDPEAQDNVRALLHEKYGWADTWVGLIQDTSQAVPVRLDPR